MLLYICLICLYLVILANISFLHNFTLFESKYKQKIYKYTSLLISFLTTKHDFVIFLPENLILQKSSLQSLYRFCRFCFSQNQIVLPDYASTYVASTCIRNEHT